MTASVSTTPAGTLPPWLAQQLAQLQGFTGQALLLHGPSGLGHFELASALAQLWLCESPLLGQACGRCTSCHGVIVHTHPDRMVLMPEAESIRRGWPLSESAQSEIDGKKRKPSKEIRVDAVREVVQFGQRTAATPRGKVVVVFPAEKMNAIAANTLLKTLEEPPGDLRFILASASLYDVLPTVRSRCIAQALVWPSEPEAAAWLVERGVSEADAIALLRYCGGRPLDALALYAEGLSAQLIRDFPQAVCKGDIGFIGKLELARVLDGLQKLCQDLSRIQAGGVAKYFAASQLPKPPSQAVLAAWGKALMQSATTAEHPFNPALMLDALLAQAAAALAAPAP